jgi:hypothetical protein
MKCLPFEVTVLLYEGGFKPPLPFIILDADQGGKVAEAGCLAGPKIIAKFPRQRYSIGAMMVTETAPFTGPDRVLFWKSSGWGPGFLGGGGMTLVMWTVWGILTAISAALYLYRSSLTRDEDDQLYLDDAFDHEKAAQEAIVARVNKIEPALRLSLWMVAGMSLVVIAHFIWGVIVQLG